MIHQEVRRSSGGSSSAMRIPNPIVTAEVPSGRVRPRSKIRRRLKRPCTTTNAVNVPTVNAIAVAAVAKTKEVLNAVAAEAGSWGTRSVSAR